MAQPAAIEINWAKNSNADSRTIIRAGLWSIGVVLFVFLIWGAFFQLSSAVITPGTLVSEGRNKLIQHAIGGTVLKIFVSEGDDLARGQVVLELDPTQAKAELSKLNARQASLLALKSRLDAERSGGLRQMVPAKPNYSKLSLRGAKSVFDMTGASQLRGTQKNDSTLATVHKASLSSVDNELMQSQRDAYKSGRELLTKEIDALDKKIITLQRQRDGVKARMMAQRELMNLTRKELGRLRPLAKQGYVARSRVTDRERTLLEIRGNVAAMKLDVASYENQIEEVLTQVEKAKITNSDTASREYARIVGELAEIADLQLAARSMVDNMVVRAPNRGTLTNLVVTTNGGVIGGGDVIGEIVPKDARLLVEARVAPSDIDYVHIGQRADIAITAFNRRLDDTLDGEVVYVSADAEKDEKTGEQYFIARLKFASLDERSTELQTKLQAGMQGEVYIHTGSRTFLTYVGKPLFDSFRRAFRER